MASFIDIWVNCPNQETGDEIADALVAERLVACANILGPISSVYQWKGRIERAGEIPLVVKTRSDLFQAVATRIKELHPYETPPIIAMDLPHIDKDYGDWIVEETRN